MLASLQIPDAGALPEVAVTSCRDHREDGALEVEGPAKTQLLSHLSMSKTAAEAASGALGVAVQWLHVASVFVTVSATLDTSRLPPSLRMALPLLLEVAFKLPVRDETGSLTTADDVIEALQAETVGYSCGLSGHSRSLLLSFSVKVYVRIRAVEFLSNPCVDP